MKVNEVKSIFTLDIKNFEKSAKQADKQVSAIQDRIKGISKEAKQAQKALDKMADIKLDVDTRALEDAKSDLDKVTKVLDVIEDAADKALDGLKDGIDLSTFAKLENLFKSLKQTEIIDLNNLSRAETMIDDLLSDLRRADVKIDAELDVDTSKLDNLETDIEVMVNAKGMMEDLNNSLRHWIDNNNGGMAQAADDTHKVLSDILKELRESTDKEINKPDTKVETPEINTEPLEKLGGDFKALADDIKSTNQSINHLADSMGSAWQNTDKYAEKIVDLQKEFDKLARKKEEIANDDFVVDGMVPDQYEDDFTSIHQEAMKIVRTVKELYAELERVANDPLQDFDDKLSIIRAGFDIATKETTEWNNELLASTKEANRLEKQIESLAHTLAGMSESHSDYDNLRREQDNLEKQYRLITKRQTLEAAVSREISEQVSKTGKLFNQQKEVYQAVKQKESAEARTTAEIKRQQKELAESEKALKEFNRSAEGIAENFSKITEPIFETTGLDQFTGKLIQIVGAAETAGAGIQGLAGAGGALGASLATVGGVLAVVAASVGGVVTGFMGLKKVMDATLPSFNDLQDAAARFIGTTGDLTNSLSEVRNAISDGFGNQGYVDNVNEYADALRRVQQQLDGLNETPINVEGTTKNVLTIAELTGYDPNEIIRAARNMAINFGTEVSTALDMMMSAYQKTGDPMNDLLDTMQEYPSQFKKMGVSAEFFYDIITRGSEAGVYNTDKIADTFKELYLRISEGSGMATDNLKEIGYSAEDIARVGNATDDVVSAFNRLGLSTNKIKDALQKSIEIGDTSYAEDAIYNIIDAIAALEDKAAQQEIIADLFGAPGEDVGSYFFEVLAEGEIAVDEFAGAVAEAASVMENTVSYQMTELRNNVEMIRASVGETFGAVLMPILQELNANFDSIAEAVNSTLIPALETLGIALVDPFLEADMTATGFIANLINGISGAIEGFAQFINVMNGVIATFRIVSNAVEIVWNGAQLVLDSLVALALGIIQMIGNVFTSIWDGVVNLVNNFDTSCKNMGIAWSNFCAGIHNSFGRAVADIQKLAASMVNNIISGLNSIPGVNIDYRANWGSNYQEKQYKQFLAYENGSNVTGKFNDYMNSEFAYVQSNMKKNISDIKKDWNDLGDAVGDLGKTFTFNSRLEETKKKLSDIKAAQKDIAKREEAIKKKPNVNTGLNGTDKTSKDVEADRKAHEKALKDLEKQKKKASDSEKKALKELEELRKKELALIKEKLELQKEAYKEIERQIKLEQQYNDDRRKWQEVLFDQQYKLMENDDEILRQQIRDIQYLKETYVLTVDEMISYSVKQFDAALKLRDNLTNRFKQSLKDQIEAMRNSAKEEYEISRKNNDKIIKDKERQIRAIEALMRQNEYDNEQEDLDYEIKKTQEELQKYLHATSLDGAQKREELQERLRELELEKKRAQNKKELEDQKDKLEQEIDDIKEKDEAARQEAEEQAAALEKIYDKMYKELEDIVNSGTDVIAKLQEYAQRESNTVVKGLLDDYIEQYRIAHQKVLDYQLSMQKILGWYNKDLDNDIVIGGITGKPNDVEDAENMKDNNNDPNWKPSNGVTDGHPDYQKYWKLKNEHASLTAKKDKTDADKNRIKVIEREVAALRKKWGVPNGQHLPKWPDGSNMNGFASEDDKLYQQEVDKINNKYDKLTGKAKTIQPPQPLSNKVNPQVTSLNSGMAQSIIDNSTNDNSFNLNIENYNNKSGSDTRRLAYEMNTMLTIKNRAKGKR